MKSLQTKLMKMEKVQTENLQIYLYQGVEGAGTAIT